MPDPGSSPSEFSFPVLGLAPARWRGVRKPAMHQAARAHGVGGAAGESAVAAVTDAYHLAGDPKPTIVISQAPADTGRAAAATDAPSAAVSWLLRRRWGRPRLDAPLATADELLVIEGTAVPAVRVSWADPRLSHVRFTWRGDRRIEIAAWQYPLGAGFFASLVEIDPLA